METFFYFLQTEPFITGLITGIILLILLASPQEREVISVRESFLVSFLRSVVMTASLLFFLGVFGSTEQQTQEGNNPLPHQQTEESNCALVMEDISREEARECQRKFGSHYQLKFIPESSEYGELYIGVFRTKDDAHRFLRENPSLYIYNPTPVPI